MANETTRLKHFSARVTCEVAVYSKARFEVKFERCTGKSSHLSIQVVAVNCLLDSFLLSHNSTRITSVLVDAHNVWTRHVVGNTCGD